MATLVYSDADGVDRSFALGNEPVMVGRAAECAIRSDDPRVSRVHARFFIDQGALWVEDLGSSNGIFVGPNKVSRAPVPTGEIILIGSLMIRLLPASGTLPPPIGLHGTLAQWLDMERKARAAVEDERDAFAQRVGELHQEIARVSANGADGASAIAAIGEGATIPPLGPTTSITGVTDPEVIRLRDEADARSAALEQALMAVQDELAVMRRAASVNPENVDNAKLQNDLIAAQQRIRSLESELSERADWSTSVGVEQSKVIRELATTKAALEEESAARKHAERAHEELYTEATSIREQLDDLRKSSTQDLEAARVELMKSREHKLVADTSVGVVAAEKLAEADRDITRLRDELAEARRDAASSEHDEKIAALTEQVMTLGARAEKAEKDLAAAQIRAQGAERNLSHANAQAAKADATAQRLSEMETRAKRAEEELVEVREKATTLEMGSGVEAAEQRATKLASDLAEAHKDLDSHREKLAEAERTATAATQAAMAAEDRASKAKAEANDHAARATAEAAKLGEHTAKVAEHVSKLADADKKIATLQSRLDSYASIDAAMAAAKKDREDANTKLTDADRRVREAEARADDAEKRGIAADTMAKAMAKDVAEALRRAADADMKGRSTVRELAEAQKRADAAEARLVEGQATTRDYERKASESDAKVTEVEREASVKVQQVQAKLDGLQRELAAERSTSLTLVDRKTQLERELTSLPELQRRADEAEKKVAEYEVQIETLQERIDDLESGIAVEKTASASSAEDARARMLGLEAQLAEARTTATQAGKQVTDLSAKLAAQETDAVARLSRSESDAAAKLAKLEGEAAARLAKVEQDASAKLSKLEAETTAAATRLEADLDDAIAKQKTADAALTHAQQRIDALERSAQATAGTSQAEQDRLEDALAKISDRDRELDGLRAKAEVADLAVGRASALQRQLDEALAKLSYLERDLQGARGRESKNIGQTDAAAAERIASAEARAQAAEGRIAEAERRAAAAEESAEELDRRLAGTDAKIADLEREVATADNVRSFAANTEREIARLERELRDARTKLTALTGERDQLAADLRESRGDTDTNVRRAPAPAAGPASSGASFDPEVTAQADVSKYEAIILKAQETEKRISKLEGENEVLKGELIEAEKAARAAEDRADDPTRTGEQLPVQIAEHVSALEESIDSLRANMRAASDETAMMDPTDSVQVVAAAVSQAAEHVERARAALRALASSVGL